MEKKDVMSARKYRAQFLRQKTGKALSLFGVYFFLIRNGAGGAVSLLLDADLLGENAG